MGAREGTEKGKIGLRLEIFSGVKGIGSGAGEGLSRVKSV